MCALACVRWIGLACTLALKEVSVCLNQALVAPYEWQCFYIPIVREDMMDAMLGAPFPKMLGWVKTKEIQNPVLEFSDVGYS